MNQATAASTIGINVKQLQILAANPQAPSIAADGTLVDANVATFAATYAACLAKGWKIAPAAMRSFDFAHGSANAPGPNYSPALADPLFDDYP